jgi:hypothetical protein
MGGNMETKEGVVMAPAGADASSDQLLKEIEEQERQLEAEAEKSAPEPESSPKVDGEVETPADKPGQEEAASEPPEVPAPGGSYKGEIDEWMKKKGLKTDKEVALYLRNFDREFHRTRKEAKERHDVPETSPPTYQPPQYDRPNPIIRQEELARRYNMNPEDFEKVLNLVNDASEFKFRAGLQPFMDKIQRLERDIVKEKEMARLESDPLFQNREVQYEMSRILEDDPSILGREPEPLTYAFNKGLANLGRRFVGSSNSNGNEAGDSRLKPPTTPPPAGKGTGGAVKGVSIKTSDGMTEEKFRHLSAAEQEKYLKSKGAFQKDMY